MSPSTRTASRVNATHPCAGNRSRHPGRRPRARNRAARKHAAVAERPALGRYRDWRGHPREIVTLSGAGDTVLVLDRDAITLGDRRLLAHLAADEPPENAVLVSRCFLDQARSTRCSCRRLLPADLLTVPFAQESEAPDEGDAGLAAQTLQDADGRTYRVGHHPTGANSIAELRWGRRDAETIRGACEVLTVREVIASLERYEPVLTLTRRAIGVNCDSKEVSVAVLRAELVRMQESPIVLNRGLRAAVTDVLDRGAASMSEIAMRCGRIKRDSSGNESGETSWLARRLGLLPEGGRRRPTPWIHSEVLALIARDGLGLSPREVEAD
jgi:hypothetical protein